MQDETNAAEAVEAVRVPNGAVSNPLAIVWPQDTAGFTVAMRRAGTTAAGRINGSAEKLAVFLETLRVLGAHAKAKHARGAQDRVDLSEQARSAAVAAREADLANAEAVAAAMEERAAAARAEAASLAAAMAGK